MSDAVYICELCNYRGTSPLTCSNCGTQVVFIDKENVYCPRCNRYLHGLEGNCDGCGSYLEPEEVHFEPLDQKPMPTSPNTRFMVHLVHPNRGASQTVGKLYAKTLERKARKHPSGANQLQLKLSIGWFQSDNLHTKISFSVGALLIPRECHFSPTIWTFWCPFIHFRNKVLKCCLP